MVLLHTGVKLADDQIPLRILKKIASKFIEIDFMNNHLFRILHVIQIRILLSLRQISPLSQIQNTST